MTVCDEYVSFCEGVRVLTGVDLSHYRRGQMERRIRSFAEAKRMPTLGSYLQELRRSPDAVDQFLDRVTINVSELFRNPEQWQRLRRVVLSELADRRRVRIWSAGCSIGAEAYTLACLARDTLRPDAHVYLLGSDVDRRVLDQARRGWFTADHTRSTPPAVLRRWFEPCGDGYEVRPQLRAMCRFTRADLLRDRYERGFDLILCRNVVIYFTESSRRHVHEQLAASLLPGGYLMVGATERIGEPGEIGLEPVSPYVYRRVA